MLSRYPMLAASNTELFEIADATDVASLLKAGLHVKGASLRSLLFGAHAEKIDLLVSRVADIKGVKRQLGLPLADACLRGDDAAVEALLGHGATTAVTAPAMKFNPFPYAAATCKIETVEKMAALGANSDLHGKNNGYTSLMCAVVNPDVRVLPWMLQRGIDVNARTHTGVTALGIAKYKAAEEINKPSMIGARNRFQKMIDLLEQNGAKATRAMPPNFSEMQASTRTMGKLD